MGGLELLSALSLHRSDSVGIKTAAIASLGMLILVAVAAMTTRLGSNAKKLVFSMIVILILGSTLLLAADAYTNRTPQTTINRAEGSTK